MILNRFKNLAKKCLVIHSKLYILAAYFGVCLLFYCLSNLNWKWYWIGSRIWQRKCLVIHNTYILAAAFGFCLITHNRGRNFQLEHFGSRPYIPFQAQKLVWCPQSYSGGSYVSFNHLLLDSYYKRYFQFKILCSTHASSSRLKRLLGDSRG